MSRRRPSASSQPYRAAEAIARWSFADDDGFEVLVPQTRKRVLDRDLRVIVEHSVPADRGALDGGFGSLRSEEAEAFCDLRPADLLGAKGHRIGLGDYLVAATATVHGLRLATLNVRHFPMVDDLVAPFNVQ